MIDAIAWFSAPTSFPWGHPVGSDALGLRSSVYLVLCGDRLGLISFQAFQCRPTKPSPSTVPGSNRGLILASPSHDEIICGAGVASFAAGVGDHPPPSINRLVAPGVGSSRRIVPGISCVSNRQTASADRCMADVGVLVALSGNGGRLARCISGATSVSAQEIQDILPVEILAHRCLASTGGHGRAACMEVCKAGDSEPGNSMRGPSGSAIGSGPGRT
jgi:hypothetical protein